MNWRFLFFETLSWPFCSKRADAHRLRERRANRRQSRCGIERFSLPSRRRFPLRRVNRQSRLLRGVKAGGDVGDGFSPRAPGVRIPDDAFFLRLHRSNEKSSFRPRHRRRDLPLVAPFPVSRDSPCKPVRARRACRCRQLAPGGGGVGDGRGDEGGGGGGCVWSIF
jgi:hypothetical protein